MFVKEVMTSPAVTVRADTSVKEAIQLLERHEITAMPVVDGKGVLVGVLSEADVIQNAVLHDPRAHELPVQVSSGPRPTKVLDLMSHHVLSVPVNADLSEAADLMVSTVVKSLPVVDGDKVVGVVSRRDIIHLLARRDDLIEVEIDDLVRLSGEDWIVDVKDGVVTIDGAETGTAQDLARVLAATVPGVVAIYFKR